MDVGSDPASSENDTMDASPSTPSPGEDGDEMMITVDATKKDPSVSFSESGAGQKGISASQEEDARQMIDMLRGDDVSGRIAAANKLESVAAALGEERTREELLPFLIDGVDDEDEVLAAIAGSLGKLIPHVGGPARAHALLPPLELLLAVEESTVRDEATESTLIVADALPQESFQNQYAEMMSRLATREWFTARVSACALIAKGFGRLTSDQQESHLQHYASLCRDDAPMVRRVAAHHLGTLLQNVVKTIGPRSVGQDGMVTTSLLTLYEELAANDQPDSVRLQTTENCIAFGKAMTSLAKGTDEDGNEIMGGTLDDDFIREGSGILVKRILPLIVSTIDDRSWRVRWTAASKFAEVVKSFADLPDAMDSLVPAYEKLLQDPEAEVRTAATFNLADVAKCKAKVHLPPRVRGLDGPDTFSPQTTDDNELVSVAERLVQRVTNLTEDDSENVRAALAMVATELAPILGKDATIHHLVPPVLLLLRDATSEVRLNIISSLSALNEVIGVDLLSQSLLPAIIDLAQDGKWRIRLAIIQHIPLLAKQLGKDFFSEKLSSLCVTWLGDDISSIRQAAATNLKELTAVFGSEFAINFLLPSIADIRQHNSYLRRLTAVRACALMATEMEPQTARTELLPMVLEMANDAVPNIRFNVAKGLQMMAPICGREVCDSQIRPVLALLVEDPDRDVRFFAVEAIKSLDKEFGGAK